MDISSQQIIIDDTPATTTFVHDGSVPITADFNAPYANDFTIREQSLRDFLAKPILIATGAWTTSSAETIDLAGAVLPSALLRSKTQWANKTQGYTLMRYTSVLTVVLNATPFHAGRLVVVFVPGTALESGPDRFQTVAGLTMLPNVELDCRDTAAQLKIPYVSPADYMNISDSEPYYVDQGAYYLKVLSPLVVGASVATSDVDYAIYLHFEDVEMCAPAILQSSSSAPRAALPRVPLSAESHGLISDGLRLTSKIAGSLGAVPVLKPYVHPTAWALRAAGLVASEYGWSKPVSEGQVTRVNQNGAVHMVNATGQFPGAVLALNHDSSVAVTNAVSLRAEDEMSLAFLRSREMLWETFSWAVGTTTSTQVSWDNSSVGQLMSPALTYRLKTVVLAGGHSAIVSQDHPACYLQRFFKLWRGGIRVRIKMVKTQFHSGRLQVTWTPTNVASPVVPTTVTGVLSMREILDISVANEYVFDLPYLAALRYLTAGDSSGHLDILVVNQLRAPETVAQTIKGLVYVSFCDDFELAVPCALAGNYQPTTMQCGHDITLQTGDDVAITSTIPLGGVPINPPKVDHALLCIGERFDSIKQVLSRFTQLFTYTATNTVDAGGLYLYPWINTVMYYNGSTAMVPSKPWGGDAYNYLCGMYAYFRGGMRFTIRGSQASMASITNAVGTQAETVAYSYESQYLNVGTTINWYTSTPKYGLMGSCFTQSYQGIAQVELPYYCQARISPVEVGSNAKASTLTSTTTPYLPKSRLNHKQTENGTAGMLGVYYEIHRAVADDFAFSYFLGPPLVLISFT